MSENQIINQTTTMAVGSVDQTYADVQNLLSKYIEISHGYCYNNNLVEALGKKYKDNLSSVEAYKMLDKIISNDIMEENFQVSIKIYFTNNTFSPDYVTFLKADDNIKKSSFYKAAEKSQGKIIWGESKNGIYIAQKIHDINGRNLGVFKMDIAKDEIFFAINKYSPSVRNNLICDENARVMISNCISDIGSTIKSRKYYKLIEGKNDGVIDYKDTQKYKIIFRSFEVIKGMPKWRIISIIPTDNLITEGEKIKNTGLILYLLCLLISVVSFILLLNRITGRISLLVEKIKEAGKGRFQLIEDKGPMDEIGILNKKFNNMSTSLDKLIYENYETKLKLNEITIKKREAELYALQSKIQPHFLFNTLESIRMKLERNNTVDAGNMIISLSRLLRKSLNWSGEIITLGEEIDFVKNYLEIQKYRFKEKLCYEIDIPDNLQKNKILKFTIQPLVENSIKHGLENKLENGKIKIAAYILNENLKIVIEDDGIGIDTKRLNDILTGINGESKNEQNSSIGLKNIHERILLHYGSSYGIDIISEKNIGTKVIVTLPVNI